MLVPSNLACLVPPRIPEAAWDKLDGSAKYNDGLYAGFQTGFSLVGSKLAGAMEILGPLSAQFPDVFKAQKSVQTKFLTHLKKLVSGKFLSNSESLLDNMEEKTKFN